jgi:hypothetical protein
MFAIEHQILPGPRCQTIIVGELNRALWTGLDALDAEQAAPHIEAQPAAGVLNRIRWAGFCASLAPVKAFGLIEYRQAAKSIRTRRRRFVGIGRRAITLSQTFA